MTEEEIESLLRQTAKKMADDIVSTLCGNGALHSPRPTALRLTPSGKFETVELLDDGSIIEPPKRCGKCGPVLLCAEHMAMIA